uniref:Uncharacterized protein n=1 Tax=Physcomitrium patens TaxID=3218 RepID=A0A2K1IYY3_PHYPA|nr:hypothetical protein PHYPA_024300 [Physcomitrium patens]
MNESSSNMSSASKIATCSPRHKSGKWVGVGVWAREGRRRSLRLNLCSIAFHNTIIPNPITTAARIRPSRLRSGMEIHTQRR